jgi:hypothetical protein
VDWLAGLYAFALPWCPINICSCNLVNNNKDTIFYKVRSNGAIFPQK